jgi:hypothetical protein
MTTPSTPETFKQWWAESYPTPPGPHAITTHVAYGEWLLRRQGQPKLSDQDIIDLATKAGVCFPRCWSLDLPPEDWEGREIARMSDLRRFAELLASRGSGQ